MFLNYPKFCLYTQNIKFEPNNNNSLNSKFIVGTENNQSELKTLSCLNTKVSVLNIGSLNRQLLVLV